MSEHLLHSTPCLGDLPVPVLSREMDLGDIDSGTRLNSLRICQDERQSCLWPRILAWIMPSSAFTELTFGL